MDHRITYMIVSQMCSSEAKKELMTDEDFSALSLTEQAAELRRAIDISGVEPSLIYRAYSAPLEKTDSEPPSPLAAAVTVSAMLAGFAVICAGLYMAIGARPELGGILLVIGTVITAGIPMLCRLLEKRADARAYERMKGDPKYTDIINRIESKKADAVTADTNYSRETQPKKAVYTAASGITLVMAALTVMTLLREKTLGIVFGALVFAGFGLISYSMSRSKKRDAAIMTGFPALMGLMLLVSGVIGVFRPDSYIMINLVSAIIYGTILLSAPIIYNLIKHFRCTETVSAGCIYVRFRRSRRNHDHTPYWAYIHNGKFIIHKDLPSRRSVGLGDDIQLRINPSDPHDVYRVKLPQMCIYTMLFCAFSAFFLFSAAAGFPLR